MFVGSDGKVSNGKSIRRDAKPSFLGFFHKDFLIGIVKLPVVSPFAGLHQVDRGPDPAIQEAVQFRVPYVRVFVPRIMPREELSGETQYDLRNGVSALCSIFIALFVRFLLGKTRIVSVKRRFPQELIAITVA